MTRDEHEDRWIIGGVIVATLLGALIGYIIGAIQW
jgi:hypothetical protein